MKSIFFIYRCNQTGSPLTTPNFSTPYDKDIPSCFTNDTVPQCTEFDYESPIFVSSVVDEVWRPFASISHNNSLYIFFINFAHCN